VKARKNVSLLCWSQKLQLETSPLLQSETSNQEKKGKKKKKDKNVSLCAGRSQRQVLKNGGRPVYEAFGY
jgi:hypothetical protein